MSAVEEKKEPGKLALSEANEDNTRKIPKALFVVRFSLHLTGQRLRLREEEWRRKCAALDGLAVLSVQAHGS